MIRPYNMLTKDDGVVGVHEWKPIHFVRRLGRWLNFTVLEYYNVTGYCISTPVPMICKTEKILHEYASTRTDILTYVFMCGGHAWFGGSAHSHREISNLAIFSPESNCHLPLFSINSESPNSLTGFSCHRKWTPQTPLAADVNDESQLMRISDTIQDTILRKITSNLFFLRQCCVCSCPHTLPLALYYSDTSLITPLRFQRAP